MQGTKIATNSNRQMLIQTRFNYFLIFRKLKTEMKLNLFNDQETSTAYTCLSC